MAHAQTHWHSLASGMSYTELPTNSLGGRLHAFKFAPKKFRFKVALAKTYHQKYLTIQSFVRRNNALIGINGGFFSPDWKPLGLRQVNQKTLSKFKPISWWGVALFNNDGLKIISSKEYRPTYNADYAVQSGPRLVINHQVPKLKTAIAERSAICTDGKETLIIIANNHPVEINHFARILSRPYTENGLACQDALNLDGGSSSQLFSQIQNKKLMLAGLSQITDALIVEAK